MKMVMTDKIEHTPGPWTIHDTKGRHARYRVWSPSTGFASIATIDGDSLCSKARKNQEANARLIASAPELLEVCQEIAALADGQGRLNMMEVAGHARQVISKTRGKS